MRTEELRRLPKAAGLGAGVEGDGWTRQRRLPASRQGMRREKEALPRAPKCEIDPIDAKAMSEAGRPGRDRTEDLFHAMENSVRKLRTIGTYRPVEPAKP